jgi:hypothetical protein
MKESDQRLLAPVEPLDWIMFLMGLAALGFVLVAWVSCYPAHPASTPATLVG